MKTPGGEEWGRMDNYAEHVKSPCYPTRHAQSSGNSPFYIVETIKNAENVMREASPKLSVPS